MQLLQNGKAQFIDQNGLPLANGTVGYYAPGTLNPQTTYQDQAGTIQNTNPITLDSRGQAIVWGSGTYRQIVKDVNGVTIWDQIVTDSGLSSFQTNLADTVNTANGDALIGVMHTATGSVGRTQHDKNLDRISVFDFMTQAQRNDVRTRTASVGVSSAVQAALSALITAGGGELLLPAGNYYFDVPVVLDIRHASIRVIGEAPGKGATAVMPTRVLAATTAFATATTGSYVPGIGTGSNGPLYGFTFENMSIEGKTATHNHLMMLDALYSCDFNNLYINGQTVGYDNVQLTNFADITFRNLRSAGAGKHCVNIGDARASNASTTIRFYGGYIRSARDCGIYGIGAGQMSNVIVNGTALEVIGRDPSTYQPIAAALGVGIMLENVTHADLRPYCEGNKNADIVLGGVIDGSGNITKKGICNAVDVAGYYYGSAGASTGTNCVDGILLVNANQVDIGGHWANHSRAEHTIRATAIGDVANVFLRNQTYGSVPSGYVNDNWNRVSPSDIPSKWLLGGSLKAQPTTTTAAGVFAAELSGDGLRLPGNTSTTNLKTGNGYRYFDSTYSLTGTYITDGFYYDPSPRYISYAGNPPATLPAGYGEYYANPTGAVTSALPTGVVTGQKIKVSNFSSTGGNTITLTGTAYASVVVNPGKTAILTWSATSGNWSSTV